MEKGKNYLVLIRTKKENVIREVECLDVTETCYKICFKSCIKNVYSLDLFTEKIQWILKTDFEDFDILEELPQKTVFNVADFKKITKDTTTNELFGDEKKKTKKKKQPISFQKSTEM